MSKKNIQPFYKILTDEGADEATMLLYGYIGESYSWDSEKWKMDGVTDVAFVQEFNRLAAKYQRIHLRLNSYGGDFLHGNAIMTAIANSTAEVHTWNDGIAASMAADIWLCGHVRHMAKNAMLMIHPTWSLCAGNAKDMRECADLLDKLSDAAIIATAASTGVSEEEMRRRYYADYADHWLTYADAVNDALVSDTDDEYEAAAPTAAKSLHTMTYKELVEHFEKNTDTTPEAPGLLARLRSLWEKNIEKIAGRATVAPPVPPSHAKTTTTDMTLEEFRTSLADNTLDLAAVKAHIAEVEGASAADPEPDPEPEPPADALETVQAEITALKMELKAAKALLEEYGAKPGAGKSTPGMPGKDASIEPAKDPLKNYNEQMAEMAKSGRTPFRPQV